MTDDLALWYCRSIASALVQGNEDEAIELFRTRWSEWLPLLDDASLHHLAQEIGYTEPQLGSATSPTTP